MYKRKPESPMQLIILPRLSKENNYWMQILRNDLQTGPEIRQLISAYESKADSLKYQALMDVVVRANHEEMEAEKGMCDALRELFADELETSNEQARKQGLEQGLEQVNKLNRCLSENGRVQDIIRAASDAAYQKKLFKEFML